MAGISIYSTLAQEGRDVKNNYTDYQYRLQYVSRSNNTNTKKQGISPLSIINDEHLEYTYNNDTYNISTLSFVDNFSKDKQDWTNDYDDSSFDILSHLNNNLNIDFIDLLSQTKMIASVNNYLNQFVIRDGIEQGVRNIIDKVLTSHDEVPVVDYKWVVNEDDSSKMVVDDSRLYTVGLNNIGQIVDATFDGYNSKVFAIGNQINWLNESYTKGAVKKGNLNSANLLTFIDSELYKNDWFADSSVQYKNLDLYISYINQISSKFNIETKYRNQMVYSNQDQKIEFVDRTSDIYGTTFQKSNSVNIKMIKKEEHYNQYSSNTILLSNRFASKNNFDVGGSFDFANNKGAVLNFNIGGLVMDYNNSYPLIYDTDVIPNTTSEAIVYVSDSMFNDKSQIKSNYVVDNSLILFSHNGDNFGDDFSDFQNVLHLNPQNILEATKLTKNDTLTNKLRNNMINYFASAFLYSFLFLFLIFFIIGLSSIAVLITKDIKAKMQMLGILKANGYYNFEIALEYGLKTFIPTLIAGVIGYLLMFGVQALIFQQTQMFFDFNIHMNLFIWQFILFYCCISIFMFLFGLLTALWCLRGKTIDLINMQEKGKNKNILLNLIDKLKIKHYGVVITLKQFATSFKKVISLSVIMFIVATLISLLMSVPVGIKKIETDYYKNVDYTLSNQYQLPTVNAPLSYYSSYDDSESYDTIMPDAYDIDGTGKPLKLSDIDFDNTNIDYLFNIFGYNFLYLKNKHFSIGAFNNIIDLQKSLSQSCSQNNVCSIRGLLDQLASSVLPSFFGQEAGTTTSGWQDMLTQMIISKMPPELLEYWNDPEIQNQFSIDIQSTKYDKKHDELITDVLVSANDNSADLIGLNETTNLINIDLDKIKNNNEIIASTAFLSKTNTKVGSTVSVDYSIPKMQVYDVNNHNYTDIDNDWWFYDEAGNLNSSDFIPLTQTDLTKYTYEDVEKGFGFGSQYYYNDDDELVPFYKINNVVLKIPNSIVLPDSLIKKGVVESEDGFYLINPYSWKFSDSSDSVNTFSGLIQYIQAFGKEPDTWYDVASNYKVDEESNKNNFITVNNVNETAKYKIIGEVGIYDKNSLYTYGDYLNQSIGIPSSVSSNWFNAKISDNEILEDLFTRFGVAIKDGNSSFEGIKNFNSQTKSTNPVGEKIAMFDQIYLFTLKLVILFLIIIFVIAIVSVSMVSGIFIEKFYNTIILYKVMGYRNFEIHKMILGIFLPVNVLFTIIGSFIPTIVVYAAIKLLASSGGMVIPSIFMWYIPIGVDAVITLLYISIYWYNYNSFNKKHIQEKLQF
jgi:hypothetical protein